MLDLALITRVINFILAVLAMILLHVLIIRGEHQEGIFWDLRGCRNIVTWKYLTPLMILLLHTAVYYMCWIFKLTNTINFTDEILDYWSSVLRMQELLTYIGLFTLAAPIKELWRTLCQSLKLVK